MICLPLDGVPIHAAQGLQSSICPMELGQLWLIWVLNRIPMSKGFEGPGLNREKCDFSARPLG